MSNNQLHGAPMAHLGPRNAAPPKKPWNDSNPLQTKVGFKLDFKVAQRWTKPTTNVCQVSCWCNKQGMRNGMTLRNHPTADSFHRRPKPGFILHIAYRTSKVHCLVARQSMLLARLRRATFWLAWAKALSIGESRRLTILDRHATLKGAIEYVSGW